MQGKKVVVNVSSDIILCISNFQKDYTDFTSLTSLLNSYYIFYLANPNFLTSSDILLFNQLPGKSRNNFSFYLSSDNFSKLTLLAESNLRSVKDQGLHMVYTIYKYIRDNI